MDLIDRLSDLYKGTVRVFSRGRAYFWTIQNYHLIHSFGEKVHWFCIIKMASLFKMASLISRPHYRIKSTKQVVSRTINQNIFSQYFLKIHSPYPDSK